MFTDGLQAHYAFYFGNGLEANNLLNPLGVLAPDPRIANMTHQLRDRFSRNKAWGARVGLLDSVSEHPFELGLSFYTGAWDTTGALSLRMAGLDGWYRHGAWDFRSEGVIAWQDMPALQPLARKWSWYMQAAYRYLQFEPILRVDAVYLANPLNVQLDRARLTAGLNYHLDKFFMVKGSYEWVRNRGIDIADDRYMLTLTAGF